VEVEEGVVAVVADVGVVTGPAPEVAGVEAFADVLVDLPGNAGFLEDLGVGGPVVAGFGVVDDGAAVFAVVADPAGPHVVAVGVGGAEERAVVGVADGEGVGEGVVVRDVTAREVRHGGGAFLRHPLVVVAFVPGCVRGGPVVGEVLEELEAEVGGSGLEGEDVVVAAVGLLPDGVAVGQGDGAGVAEAADAAEGAEVVIEGTVFLHHEDDVLDVVDAAGAVVGGDAESLGDACREGCGEGGGA
jgi:hypothetical protein